MVLQHTLRESWHHVLHVCGTHNRGTHASVARPDNDVNPETPDMTKITTGQPRCSLLPQQTQPWCGQLIAIAQPGCHSASAAAASCATAGSPCVRWYCSTRRHTGSSSSACTMVQQPGHKLTARRA